MMYDWDYFDKFDEVTDKYLPPIGQGETKATQIVTAVTKLVYKWFNDGDVYDNTYALEGWWNNLSSYANWLVKYTDECYILYAISKATSEDDYTAILAKLADSVLDEEYLSRMDKIPAEGSIYDCDGDFQYKEDNEGEDEDWY